MRLIDADELKKEVPKKLARLLDGRDYEETYYKYEVIKAINTMPTVEAIPVEWLEKNALSQLDFGIGLRMLIQKWRKENEDNA